MHTIALPTLPVNQAKAIACGLCLVCTTLAPLPSHAFTYDTQAGPVVVQHQSAGTPLVWPELPIALRLELGTVGHTLLNGTISWDDNAATALVTWNAVVPVFVQQATALNVVRWANPAAGEVLGMQVAKTVKDYAVRGNTLVATRATVMLNPSFCWDAYDGPLRSTLCDGRLEPLLDIQRIVLHELGHVAGLEHPDEVGQVIDAVMNHGVSDLDELTADDEAGLHFLYPPVVLVPTTEPQAVPQAQHASGGGGGCTIGAGDSPDLVLFLIPLVAMVEALRRAARGVRAWGLRCDQRERSRRPHGWGLPWPAPRHFSGQAVTSEAAQQVLSRRAQHPVGLGLDGFCSATTLARPGRKEALSPGTGAAGAFPCP